MATVPAPPETSAKSSSSLHAPSVRNALFVFFFSGLLMAFPGAILPAWSYHLRYDFVEVGHYFLAMIVGLLMSVSFGQWLASRKGVRATIMVASALASGAFLWAAVFSPPFSWAWRMAGIVLMGVSAGMMNIAAFRSLSASYARDPAATVNLAGISFGLGCFSMALVVSQSYYFYTVRSLLLLMATVPAFAAGLYARAAFAAPANVVEKPWRAVWEEVKSPGAVMFSLMLFFQFGNEWSVAGWLPIYVVHRAGFGPDASIGLLAVYWLSLLVGRVAAQGLLQWVGHGKLLMGSLLAALLGCTILMATNNRFGSWTGVLLVGAGFAAIYPLAVEKIGYRFPDYHPGFFNGLLSFGITGGLLAPWVLGYLADWWGIRMVMVIPFIGTVMVFILVLLLWLEAKLVAAPSR